MRLTKWNIAEAFGLKYFGLYDRFPQQPEPYLMHLFIFGNRNIWVEGYLGGDEALEESADIFLAPLEKILFENL